MSRMRVRTLSYALLLEAEASLVFGQHAFLCNLVLVVDSEVEVKLGYQLLHADEFLNNAQLLQSTTVLVHIFFIIA
jgi:hypothetical protein